MNFNQVFISEEEFMVLQGQKFGKLNFDFFVIKEKKISKILNRMFLYFLCFYA